MVFTLLVSVALYGLSALTLQRVLAERDIVEVERRSAEAFYAADAGAKTGLRKLDVLINTYLLNTISASNPNGVISYTQGRVNAGDGIGWLVYSVRDNNNPVLLQDGDLAQYTESGTVGGRTYQYVIEISEKSDPSSSGTDAWDFPYDFLIRSTGTASGQTRTVVIEGDFTVQVQRDNFAKYALFTNHQSLPNGTSVWFTDRTDFAGPLHTNDRFNFALNPSGVFDGAVVQHQQTARFYNFGWPILLDADANGNRDVPTFNAGFTRGASTVSLSSPSDQQDMIDQASGGQTFSNNGIYLPSSGGSLTGGIYVKGNATVTLSVDASDRQVYTITQGGTTREITVDDTLNQTTVTDPGTGNSTTYTGLPDGVDDVGTIVYVDGTVTGIGGTVAPHEEVTVAGTDDIVISDNLRYSQYTPAQGSPGDADYVPPSAQGTTNLLGLVSWTGDVRIGTSAPDDVEIHGTLLARQGIFQVDGYDDVIAGPRGTATLLGGVITDYYGAFGLFDGGTGEQLSGYGRNFVYDQRMLVGTVPPYFPSLETFVAFTNDITDKLAWREGE